MHSNFGKLPPGKTRELRELRRPPIKGTSGRLSVAFPSQVLHLEFCRGPHTLLAGNWEAAITFDGEPIQPTSDYDETCWVADKDVDYLELEIHLSGGLRLERHLVFARKDQFVFLADAVFGPRSGKIEYRGQLPLAAGMKFQPDRQHHEGVLAGKNKLAKVLPLALSEWRSETNSGQLQMQEGKLELSQTAVGRNLFAPLFIDLKSRRFGKPLTWRQLTVAESLEIQPPEVASGYRAMIGREQWLVYRSLSPKANRTLLGHNLSSEFLLARFLKKGETQSLIEVE
jgi:hypothetical protein